jgi:RNA polymerase sigma-70 factor (ECF subfamily)
LSTPDPAHPARSSSAASHIEEADELAVLVGRMADGEQLALEALYACCADRVYTVALRVLQRPEDAEEIVLDTFSQAWERAFLYVPERGAALSWLLNLAWSRAVDRLRRERGHRSTLPLHPVEGEDPYAAHADDSAQRLFDALDARSALRAARAELSPVQQRMIALAFLEDLSHAEIAERTGTALGTVKSHLRRGLATLSRALGMEARG